MMRARSLTPAGIEAARRFLAGVRERPTVDAAPPAELIEGRTYTQAIPQAPLLRQVSMTTRRDAADYLEIALRQIQRQIADDAGFWSWLGMYYFAEIAPRSREGVLKLSPLDETFVVHQGEDRSLQRRYRHYLWSAWRLKRAHVDHGAFLLDQPVNSFGDIADRVFSSPRIFNSDGVVDLILKLYTREGKQKPNFGRSPGGLRHLVRVLDQLDRTYDVYGMSAEALMRILPSEFDEWKRDALS